LRAAAAFRAPAGPPWGMGGRISGGGPQRGSDPSHSVGVRGIRVFYIHHGGEQAGGLSLIHL
ncbi:hypothetical protein, partial [Klebsiella pneumoniae]|uniref:hypothetical protein n=1 Tax=Klebsiella pneumoniae TaxID=573 RepID=UPI002730FBD8